MKLVTAEQMRQIDRVTIDERGVPGIDLMEAAGRAVAMDVAEQFESGTVVVLCGKGNNGGDGFIAARYLHEAGWRVHVVYIEEPESGDARTAWDRIPDGVYRQHFERVPHLHQFVGAHDVAIDALLGTGTKGAPRPPYDTLIEAVNRARVPVVSVDIPSGLDPDSGKAQSAVKAFRTVTMGLPKIGMVSGHGPDYCGFVRVEPLGFPADLLESADGVYTTLTMPEAAALLPARPRDGHKGTFGMLLAAAGSRDMPGASVLVAAGAMRSGCGLVRMLVPPAVRPILMGHAPEVILAMSSGNPDCLHPLKENELDAALSRATAMVFGPGAGQSGETRELLRQLLGATELPSVIDADGLNLLAEDESLRALLKPRHVLTPHPGELGRLLGRSTGGIQEDRWGAAFEAAQRFGCVVVLKGAGTIVAEPGARATHIPSGNSAWARGGAGDVLTGLIGGLLAQGARPVDAACLGAFVHGLAADVYTRERSSRGGTTSDIAACLPMAFREMEKARRFA